MMDHMPRFNRLRRPNEVTVSESQTPATFHELNCYTRRNSSGNVYPKYEQQTNGQVTSYMDREYPYLQRDTLNAKLDISRSCYTGLSSHHTNEYPSGFKTGNYESSTHKVTSLNLELKDLKRKMSIQDDKLLNLQNTLKAQEFQLQCKSRDLQSTHDCLQLSTDTVISLKSKMNDLEKQVTSQDDEIFDLKNTLESERAEFKYELQNERAITRERDDQLKTHDYQLQLMSGELQKEREKVREKDDQLKAQEYQLQIMSGELHKANLCLESNSDIVTSLKLKIKELVKQVTNQDDELFDYRNFSESKRSELRMAKERQSQRAPYREKIYQFKGNECQLRLNQRANDCLDKMVSIPEEILSSDTSRFRNTHRQSVNKQTVRRECTLFDLMKQLQQKLREMQGHQMNMTRTITIQHDTILRLRRDHGEFPGNRLHFEKEDEYNNNNKTETLFQQALDLMGQIDDDFRECISSFKQDKYYLWEKLKQLRESLKGEKDETEQLWDILECEEDEANQLREILECEEDEAEQLREILVYKDDEAEQLRETLECKNDETEQLRERLKCEKNQTEILRKRLECIEKEKRESNEKMLKMTKEHDDQFSILGERIKQQSKNAAFYKSVAESNTSVALNKKIQNLDREATIRETNVKKYEEELKSKNNELKERTILFERQAMVKDAELLKLRDQQKQKTLHQKNLEERYSSLKKKSEDLEDEVERRNVKIKELEETFDRTSNEFMDNKKQLIKTMKERDESLSQLRAMRQQAPRILNTEAYSNESYETLQWKIKSLEQELKNKDSEIKHLGKLLDSRKVSLGVLEHKEKEKNNQFLEQSVQHQQALDSLQENKAKMEDRNDTLTKKIQHLEAEVERLNEKNRGLEETLNRKKKEISDTNEQYVRAVREKNTISSQVSPLRQWTNKTYDSEAESFKTIKTLKAELKQMDEETKLRDAKVKHLEKMLENTNIKLGERISQLENRIKEKDDQLSAQSYQHHQVVTRLHEKKSESEETILSLKKEIRHLEAEVQRCNGQKRELEETLDRRKKEISESNERYLKAVKEKNIISSQVSDLQQRTNKTCDSEAELNKTIRELKVEIENMDEEMKLRDSKAKHLEKELQSEKNNLTERISQLQNKIQEKDDQLSAQSNQHQQVVRRLREKEAVLEETIASLKKKIHDLEVDALQFISKIKDLEDQLKKTKLVAKAEQKGDVPAMENIIADLKQQLKQTRTKLRDTEAELNETKTRLSKAMGERLTDNNPNITDLGDKNRPTKLAERFAELYDNQWTDAFDILEKKFDTEEKAIEALLHILQDAMSFCKTKEREQMEELRRVLVFADKTVPRGEAIDIQRLFKENRKAVASSAVENLLHAYEAHIKRSADERIQMATDVKSYAKECLEICWLMTVQDPPVVFAPLLKKGVQFNNELFRPYTKSGSNVAFVVWPALLLHDHGPVLGKGVAQGAGKP